MNMFKSRRKAKDQSEALDALTGAQSPPSAYKSVRGLKRKNKIVPEEPKLMFDLSTALPDDHELRTSLLMPNLSARFSMLREQDDPHSKLGKASDDSVLFPKRQSRMNLFNHHVLADVAEVEPEISLFRPPFADRERSSSMGDGYDSDSGSVMSRSRAGEGNNLFGGRQKLYRIPTNSTRSLANTDGSLTSRHMYDHDVALSHFQRFKKTDQELPVGSEVKRISESVTDGGESSDVASPATAFSKNRGTQSSTNSVPRRTSTAATSVDSESPPFRGSAAESVVPKPVESTIHAPDSRSVLSIVKTREDGLVNRFKPHSKTTERSQRPMPIISPIISPTSYRNASSPSVLPMAQPLDFGFKNDLRSNSATGRYQTDSPTSSHLPESDGVLASSVQPNDRGKATALGLFNKPAREFDEQQFNQRQLQMHEEQVSSMSNSRSASSASHEAQNNHQDLMPGIASPVREYRTSTPQIPQAPGTSASPIPQSNRASKVSVHSTPSRPRSKSTASIPATSNVKARIESLIQKSNAELAALEAEKLGDPDLKTAEDPSENKENDASAFFDNDDESDVDESVGFSSSRVNSSKVDESDIHPAFRNSYRISDGHSRKSNYSNYSKTRSVVDDERRDSSRLQVPTRDSDFVAQQTGVGLSGLIRTHLRQNSDKSSIFVRPESSVVPQFYEPSRVSVASTAKTVAESVHSHPFDLGVEHVPETARIEEAPPTPTYAMSQVAQKFLSQAMAIKTAAEKERPGPLPKSPVENMLVSEKSWQEDLEPKHQRGESSETTKERREFDEELAKRRRKIKEDLKSVAERERSQSPSNAARGQNAAMQAFLQQRAVTDPQPKAMKMLGLQPRNGQTGSADDDRGRNMSSRSESRAAIADEGFGNNRKAAVYARFEPEPRPERQHPPRSATPPASRQGRRDRSNSAAGDRSKSRTRNREPNPPMPQGRDHFVNWNQASESHLEGARGAPSPGPSARHDFRGAKSPPPELVTGFPVKPSQRPSPISPHSSYDSPMEMRSPGAYPSGRSTPSNGRATPTSSFSRKRSVTKTMISEPTFVSSTSSVPLVHLPAAQQSPANVAPPVPVMNPRRRGNTLNDRPVPSPIGSAFSRSTPLEPVPASPVVFEFGNEVNGREPNSPSPRKLRKANSEGGSMAAKARQQAMMAELAQESARSPAMPVFPNRSATTLGITNDGAMF